MSPSFPVKVVWSMCLSVPVNPNKEGVAFVPLDHSKGDVAYIPTTPCGLCVLSVSEKEVWPMCLFIPITEVWLVRPGKGGMASYSLKITK